MRIFPAKNQVELSPIDDEVNDHSWNSVPGRRSTDSFGIASFPSDTDQNLTASSLPRNFPSAFPEDGGLQHNDFGMPRGNIDFAGSTDATSFTPRDVTRGFIDFGEKNVEYFDNQTPQQVWPGMPAEVVGPSEDSEEFRLGDREDSMD